MVCLSDWRLRNWPSSARYRSIRRTTASTFSRGRPSPPRVSLLHMLSLPLLLAILVRIDYTPRRRTGRALRRVTCVACGDAARERKLPEGSEAPSALPGIGGYTQVAPLYLDEVEA